MSTWGMLVSTWTWQPSVLLGCALLIAVYFFALSKLHIQPGRQAWLYVGGVLVMLFALESPLDTLGDGYLFSAHMLQHMLLLLAVPPVMITGIPAPALERLLRVRGVAGVERVLRQPFLAWALSTLTLWVWHFPSLYDAALENEGVHTVQHLTFLVTAVIFWWPVVTPVEERRLGTLPSVAYLGAGALASGLLGIFITFAAPGLYPAYAAAPDNPAIGQLIRGEWGLLAAADQQIGGLLMWVPGGLVYLGAILTVFLKWLSSADEEEDDTVASRQSSVVSHQ